MFLISEVPLHSVTEPKAAMSFSQGLGVLLEGGVEHGAGEARTHLTAVSKPEIRKLKSEA